ncbi:MAG: extracellular solute-binding protein [Defluviitaleaceae bacterium]|nr:extracellular solute-binding protein [Defluviitaleaceae bacterium]
MRFAEHKNKIIFFGLFFLAIIIFFLVRGESDVLRFRDSGTIFVPVYFQEKSYAEFLAAHRYTPSGTQKIEIDIFNPTAGENFNVLTNFEGEAKVLRSEEESFVEFTVNIPVAGLYFINAEYFPVQARGIDIARELKINGEIPFTGAELITLRRVWGSGAQVREDSRGNQIRPPQVELPRWERTYFNDRLGFFSEPYRFFFEAGENKIRLTGVNEPLVLRSLSLVPMYSLPTFAEFMSAYGIEMSDMAKYLSVSGISGNPINTSDFIQIVQGENSTVRSSPSLFPLFDNSSGITNPPSVAVITLNMIGGIPWRIPGQWIEWEVEVPSDGLYKISLSARQNYNRGFVSNRSLSINGVFPFEEVTAIPFVFNNSWELITLKDSEKNDLLFPMHAGKNKIRMYVTLGELGEIINKLFASTQRLNAIYREILVLTGPEPDALRDYRIHVMLPHVMDMIYLETGILYGILNEMSEFFGERNERTGVVAAIVSQLDLFYARPHRIPVNLVNFRQNISALANTTNALTESPLDIDFIVVSGTNANLPRVNENIFTRISHEARAFVASFTHDFESIGDVHEGANVIDVWIPTGRDQAQAMKAMIDDTFTPQNGIGVNLRLVAHNAVLPAVVAGIGPDLVLSMPLSDPVNYAFRNAAVDLTQFRDFREIYGRFHHSAWIPVRFQNSYYAIPETQTFNLMFYREDILNELGLTVPKTWDDVLAMMPLLQRNNMAIGIPPIGNPMNPDITGFMTQLYQRGGFLYSADLSRARLDDEHAVAAFEAFTRFFTHYGSPEFFDPPNRFRSGEMPIIFGDFTMFNLFSVFAPEIYGLWNFALMPGYDHGEPVYFEGRDDFFDVHHTVPHWGTAAIMIRESKMQDEAWEFLKWWSSAETQLRFGREMESLMGEAARFPTANMEAFQSLPWSSSQLSVLNEQRDWILGTPEVPGGYYVMRQLINVIRRVVSNNLDTRETLLDVNIVINRELINKRREFGLE